MEDSAGETKRRVWDRDLDFSKARRMLKLEYDVRAKQASTTPGMQQLYLRQGCYIACYLTQLVNAARISEGRDALELWTKSGKRIVMIRSRKKGKMVKCLTCGKELSARAADKFDRELDPEGKSVLVRIPTAKDKHQLQTGHSSFSEPYLNSIEKRMTIPKEIRDEDKEALAWAFQTGITNNMLKVYCLTAKSLGFNTHSLRFAGITFYSALAAKTGQAPETVANISGHSDFNELLHYQQKKAAQRMQDAVALGTSKSYEEDEPQTGDEAGPSI